MTEEVKDLKTKLSGQITKQIQPFASDTGFSRRPSAPANKTLCP